MLAEIAECAENSAASAFSARGLLSFIFLWILMPIKITYLLGAQLLGAQENSRTVLLK